MNRRIFLRNVSSAVGQTVVQTLAFFVLYRFLIGRLGIEQVGVWSVVLASASAARISELGLGGSVTKFVAACQAQGDRRGTSAILQTAAITLAGALGLVLPVLYPMLSFLLALVLPGAAAQQASAILPHALLSVWFGAIAGVWQGGLDGCLRSDIRAALATGATIVFMVMAMVLAPGYGLSGLAVAQVGQSALLAALGWLAIRRVVGEMPVVPAHWSWPRLREMLGYGANVQIMAVVMLLFEPTTKLLFARYGGLTAVGHFELAQQLVTRMRALVVEGNRVVVPFMAATGEGSHEAREMYARNVKYLLFLLTPMFAGLASLVPLTSVLWLGIYRSEFVVMAVCLTAAWYVNSTTAPAYFAYLGHGDLRALTVSHLALGIGNGAIGAVLGPLFGWQGIIAAFVASLTIGSLIPVFTYHRRYRLRLRDLLSRADGWLFVGCAVAAGLGVAGTSWALQTWASVWGAAGLLAVTTGAMLAAAWRHPLAPEVRRLARRRLP